MCVHERVGVLVMCVWGVLIEHDLAVRGYVVERGVDFVGL